MKYASEGIHPGFETQVETFPEVKNRVSMAHKKGLMSSKNFFKKELWATIENNSNRTFTRNSIHTFCIYFVVLSCIYIVLCFLTPITYGSHPGVTPVMNLIFWHQTNRLRSPYLCTDTCTWSPDRTCVKQGGFHFEVTSMSGCNSTTFTVGKIPPSWKYKWNPEKSLDFHYRPQT